MWSWLETANSTMSSEEKIQELAAAIEEGQITKLIAAIQSGAGVKLKGNVNVAQLRKLLEHKIHFVNPVPNDAQKQEKLLDVNSTDMLIQKEKNESKEKTKSAQGVNKDLEIPLKSVETGEQCASEVGASVDPTSYRKSREKSLSVTNRNSHAAKTLRSSEPVQKPKVPRRKNSPLVSKTAEHSVTERKSVKTGSIPSSVPKREKHIIYNKANQLQELESKRMAGVMDRFKKKKAGQAPEWSRNGSFLNKPEVGWIHPDQQLNPDAGICYGVRYIGNIEVKESMKSLDFDTRTQVAREAINRVAEAAGLKTVTKKRKVDKRVSRMLGDNPHMQYAGANVNLTITTDSINLMVMETGEIIADHPMHVVSFASGGDAETLDFVSYVAKDPALGRACHVLECGGGLAEDVVTTVGQAFELRFKQYLQKQPKTVQLEDRRENPAFEAEKWGEEEEYYNDRPGACPPSPGPEGAAPPIPPVPEYKSPSNVSMGMYTSVKDGEGDNVYSEAKDQPLIDFSGATGTQLYDNRQAKQDGDEPRDGRNVYDNRKGLENGDSNAANGVQSDPFDLESLTSTLEDGQKSSPFTAETDVDAVDGISHNTENGAAEPGEIDLRKNPGAASEGPTAPVYEEWYHGKIARKEAEKLLELDGDFLVRESSNSTTQFVLSGKQSGNVRHLLLVDPEGIVRTKDFIFDSVSHLINYHRQNGLPIITQGSELRLVRPIKTCISSI